LKSRRFPAEVTPSHPEGDIDQANQGWHFDEWTDDDGEGLPQVWAEVCDCDGDCELEVVAGSREG